MCSLLPVAKWTRINILLCNTAQVMKINPNTFFECHDLGDLEDEVFDYGTCFFCAHIKVKYIYVAVLRLNTRRIRPPSHPFRYEAITSNNSISCYHYKCILPWCTLRLSIVWVTVTNMLNLNSMLEPKSVESDMINNVFRFVFWCKNKQRRWFASTRTGNIQLTVRKIWKFNDWLCDLLIFNIHIVRVCIIHIDLMQKSDCMIELYTKFSSLLTTSGPKYIILLLHVIKRENKGCGGVAPTAQLCLKSDGDALFLKLFIPTSQFLRYQLDIPSIYLNYTFFYE
ncbi:hypothetical protein AGLY_006558 [Aphis glycines]|uniref:Uncharacterized protein n=1 Tax=Aphis glycines TaxID=307491 RepID=A0A6G0TTQ3_APHGL|nr:hypothetical protein AGLY_006558 [Aphis glycines]